LTAAWALTYGAVQKARSTIVITVRRRKPTDFGTQLMAKQKLKGYYANISERQFRRYYAEASRRRGDTGENLVGILECRLDAVVYRMKFVPTMFASRQVVNHGHITVNGKKVNIPSYMVQPGDIVEVKTASKQMALILEAIESSERDVPDYMDVDFKSLKGQFNKHSEAGRHSVSDCYGTEFGSRILQPLIGAEFILATVSVVTQKATQISAWLFVVCLYQGDNYHKCFLKKYRGVYIFS